MPSLPCPYVIFSVLTQDENHEKVSYDVLFAKIKNWGRFSGDVFSAVLKIWGRFFQVLFSMGTLLPRDVFFSYIPNAVPESLHLQLRTSTYHLDILSHSTTSQTALNLLQLQPRRITGLYQFVWQAVNPSRPTRHYTFYELMFSARKLSTTLSQLSSKLYISVHNPLFLTTVAK
jgi:hypothetical protein